jgi:succinate dehydrogenase/fumarate reductase-like Fe-S protein
MATLSVFRWSPGERERWQEYSVATGPDTTLLDALVEVQRRLDPTLAFRYACRVGMCLSACTLVASNPRFPGPAALNRAFTLEHDHRDAAKAERWAVLLGDDALARCHGQGNCTEVCPIRLRRAAARRLLAFR